jgi:hypothetical protein
LVAAKLEMRKNRTLSAGFVLVVLVYKVVTTSKRNSLGILNSIC